LPFIIKQKSKILSYIIVKDILSHNEVHTIKSSAKAANALFEMRKNKIGRLPITNRDGKLKGIVSINDLLSNWLDRKEREMVQKKMKVLQRRTKHSSTGTV
jgi:predicted transcriptional regulator